MPRPRIAMRKIREVLRLTLGEGLSRRQVGAGRGAVHTVADYLRRRGPVGWPLPDDGRRGAGGSLSAALPPATPRRPLPDWGGSTASCAARA